MNTPRTTAGTHTPPGTDPMDSHKDSKELREDIQDTRDQLDEKLDTLGERLHPKALVKEITSTFTGEGGALFQSFAANIKRNPVPAAMVGAGLTWLLLTDSDTRGPGRHLMDRFTGGRGDSQSDLHQTRLARGNLDGPSMPRLDDDSYLQSEPVMIQPLTEDELHSIDEVFPEYRAYHESESHATRFGHDDASTQAHESRSKLAAAKDKAAAASSSALEKAKDLTESAADAVKRAASRVSSAASHAGHSVSDGAHHLGEQVGHAGSALAHTAGDLRDRAGDGFSGVSDAARQTGHYLKEQSHHLTQGVTQTMNNTAERVRVGVDQRPLGMALAALAAGVVVGMAIPSTRKEDEWLGDYADKVKDKAADAARHAKQQATDAATAAVESGKEQGLDPSSLASKASNIAHAAKDAATQQAREEGVTPGQVKDKAAKAADDAKAQMGSKHSA